MRGQQVNIFVGNLSYGSTDESLRTLFEQYGEVTSAKVIMSQETGRSRGFGFVEMPNKAEAEAAIAAIDGKDFEGRPIKVNEARPRADRRSRPPREDRW
jgi:RNA recognition motif-containing protein